MKEITSVRWNHTLWRGQPFVCDVSRHVVNRLRQIGFQAVAPEVESWYTVILVPSGNSINFSQRHAAYAAGLGTFGLSDNFISEKGVATRCVAIVTNAPIPPTPRKYDYHYGACLFFNSGSCKACITRCPGGAITESSHDSEKCRKHRFEQEKIIEALGPDSGYKNPWGRAKTSPGCGLCQTKVPCEQRIPVVRRTQESQGPRRNSRSDSRN
ncbi:MAG: hypothetical protein HYX90_07040 [Chloroflexi bacterium]|nr:hypothetical protein [Chloroflexota bacterium]